MSPSDLTEDAFLGGRLRLRQPRKGHRAGHDAMLLAAAAYAQAGERVVEFGAGVGAAGLALASRVGPVDLTLVDLDEQLVALARENAALNGIECRAIVLDVTAKADAFLSAGLAPDSADRVLMNPPFNTPARHQPSPDPGRRSAHEAMSSDAWVHAARRLLKPGGTLTLIWRADGLGDILAALGRGFGAIAILPVHPKSEDAAIRLLVKAEKGSGAPLQLLAGLVLNDDGGAPTAQADRVLRGEETLRLDGN
ncbi:methyltransferase [Bradyrhizobium sp. LHD-71]|uniref:tRNA1(Val) (adenine(37)-N6)-methyltransferase n=1 Tax=Bradyrhizobium sp. LHD-71 TaxID=3072141 RepID=UPI00280CF584|nr:methyltransferase [Bradyrhizobium sp. LHD-71]MDQ8730795.1 methyltransferase [Bradyrhizobium sp. LHD-71]